MHKRHISDEGGRNEQMREFSDRCPRETIRQFLYEIGSQKFSWELNFCEPIYQIFKRRIFGERIFI